MAMTNAERQKIYRAKKQAENGQATGEKQPTAKPNALAGFTGPQLEALRAIVREELQSLLAAKAEPALAKPHKPARASDGAARVCPVCGGHVIGGPLKVYCCTKCRRCTDGSHKNDFGASVRFDDFWAAWPTGYRSNIAMARHAWAKRGLDSVADDVICHLERLKRNPEWVPTLPATFLNGLRFDGANS